MLMGIIIKSNALFESLRSYPLPSVINPLEHIAFDIYQKEGFFVL